MNVNPYESPRLSAGVAAARKLHRWSFWKIVCISGLVCFVCCELANRILPDPDNFPSDPAHALYEMQFGLTFSWLLGLIAVGVGVFGWLLAPKPALPD
jgi:hypothetical protein